MKTKIEQLLWLCLEESINLSSAFLLRLDELREIHVESCHRVAAEPFRGADRFAIVDVIEDIYKTSSSPHGHSIKRFALSNLVPRHGGAKGVAAVVNFCELVHEGEIFVFLVFPKDNKRSEEDLQRMVTALPAFAELFSLKRRSERLDKRVQVTELFVREVGHDLATAVQAVISKLRIICDGAVDVAVMREKASEALVEVMNAYSTADSLGLAVDSDYIARSETWFSLEGCIDDAILQLEAEAKERDLNVKVTLGRRYHINGDRPAILLAFKHLLMNAIKYSVASRSIHIELRQQEDQIVLEISNVAFVKLPKSEDRKKIYDFGYRAASARKEHVNGSGVGLFTARKIILAHQGLIWCKDVKDITKFYISFPYQRVRV